MEEKEAKIKRITHLYYSNPKIQETLLKFAKDREVVPKYLDFFGKRPDNLAYISDIMGLVKKGATSFHCSEEIWEDPLKINSEMSQNELNEIRRNWDLIIDIDSKYLDYAKIAAKLIISCLEKFGIKNHGVKFSGSRGFHIIVSGESFPSEFLGMKKKDMFPMWPKTICEFLMSQIKPEYNKIISKLNIDFKALEERTNLSKEEISETICPECGRQSKKGNFVEYQCPECKTSIKRKDPKITKKKLLCINNDCPGKLEIIKEEDYFYCEHCNISSIDKNFAAKNGKVVYSRAVKKETGYTEDFIEEISGSALADLDLVLVAPRHLFRMPYSLHEKTSLASVVLLKDEIEDFNPLKDADPLNVKIRNFLPDFYEGEGIRLLTSALEWKRGIEKEEDRTEKKKYSNYEKIDIGEVKEEMFPKPIKKLLKGLKEGRKRGLFILLTFLRSLNFSPDYINQKIREWNKLNEPPLKEGYVKGQIDWHLKQKKKILPPNYNHDSFYKDLGLLDEKPNVKNPIVEVLRRARRG